MKHLIIIFSLFLLVSCGQEKVEYKDLVKKEGIYYYKFSEKKFTGEFKGKYVGKIKKGKKEGRWLEYRNNGNLWSEINYKNNKRHGISKSYEDNGNLKHKDNYKNGKRHGKQFYYYGNGEVMFTSIYKDGELISKIKH